MSLTGIRTLELARRKFFMKPTYIMSTKKESNVFVLRRRNESNSHPLARIDENKIFMNWTYIMSRK